MFLDNRIVIRQISSLNEYSVQIRLGSNLGGFFLFQEEGGCLQGGSIKSDPTANKAVAKIMTTEALIKCDFSGDVLKGVDRAEEFVSDAYLLRKMRNIVAYGGAAIGMAVAVSEFLKGNISVAGTLCIVLLASEFFLPLRLLGSFFHIAMNGMAASDKIFKILDLPEPQAGEKTLPDGALDVTLKDVHFSYEEDREILKGIGLNLPAGSFVSLVGESGCGKSTIAGILAAKNRGYNGEIIIGGVPLNEVNETNLMQRVVLVRHNSYLFKGTVEENLKMAKPDATKEEMEAVLQKVNLLGFLQTQDGLQTQLLEKASNLSGGQCQRLVIARALLRTDSAVYIFDEAASNIDVESEELIMNVIHELAKTKTVLLISHRLANVVKSDKIYFLKDGEIKESGKHDELMSQNGAYRHLYESQMALENYGKGGMA